MMIVTHNVLPDYYKEEWFQNRFKILEFKHWSKRVKWAQTPAEQDVLYYRYNLKSVPMDEEQNSVAAFD